MIKVLVYCEVNTVLIDRRPGYAGLNIGEFSAVAKQYGVSYSQGMGYIECLAPQSRMQFFVDKIDSSAITYEIIR
jgi:hypothetical protein